jgi:bis(5'-nucleosyl)-tetraphosphatase (symmetrical)
MKIIVYGDLHGCLDEFKALRANINPSSVDREIVVGDILDRGPKSNLLFTYIREHGIESLMGNHEYKYLRYKKHHDKFLETGKKNPMSFDDEKLEIFNAFSSDDLEFLASLPYFIKIDNLTLVHAGITNNVDLDTAKKKDLEKLLWVRYLKDDNVPLSLGEEDETSKFWSEWYDGEQGIIIYGHQPFSEVRVDKYSIGIDTGCVYANRLSACIVSDTKNPMQHYEIVDIKSEYGEKYAKRG